MQVLSENRNTQKRSSKGVIKEQHNTDPHALLQARRRHLAGSTRQPSTRPSANEVQVLGRNIRSLSLVAIWVWRSKAHIHLIHSVLSLFSLILFYIFLSGNPFVFFMLFVNILRSSMLSKYFVAGKIIFKVIHLLFIFARLI